MTYEERVRNFTELTKNRPDLSHEEAWNLANMTHWNHLEPASQGPTFPESLAVVMLFSLLCFIMVCCAFGELTLKLFPLRKSEFPRHGGCM